MLHQILSMFSGAGLENLIKTVGYIGVFVIIFAESGLLIGFFLPGDSLLFTAGLLAAQGLLSIYLLAPLVAVAAILGDSVGYMFGRRIGPRLFNRDDSLLFQKKNVLKAQAFFDKHGSKTIVLARFIPIVRTFTPIVAGVGQMQYQTFVTYNVVGGILWAMGVSVAGYFLGTTIPNIDKYLLPIIIGIVVLSILPPVVHLLRERQQAAKTKP